MKKRNLLPLLFGFLLLPGFAAAQSDYGQIVSTLKDPHVSAETVDALLPQLQALEKKEISNRDSQQVAQDIFLQAAYAYARNFHFKQGLLVFQGYLDLKDKFASLDKTNAVSELVAKNKQRQDQLNDEISKKKNAVDQLNMDIDSWKKMNGKFSRNYSLVVILLTAVLALVFIRINMHTVRAKNKLRDNRHQMTEMQRMAVLGRFHDGTRSFLKSSSSQLAARASTLSSVIQENKLGELTATKGLVELVKKFEQAERKIESFTNTN